MTAADLAALASERLDWRFKAVPAAAWGDTVAEYLATKPALADLGTPLLTLDAGALDHNLRTMALVRRRRRGPRARQDDDGLALGSASSTRRGRSPWPTRRSCGSPAPSASPDPCRQRPDRPGRAALARRRTRPRRGRSVTSWADCVRTPSS